MSIVSQATPVQTVTAVSPLQIFAARTVEEMWFDGFQQFAACLRDGDYLSKEELAAMTPAERKGYQNGLDSHDYAETNAYLNNTNSYGDRS
jgi:hypothetical protein